MDFMLMAGEFILFLVDFWLPFSPLQALCTHSHKPMH